uniref:CARDB domain-containing protein n=1 Tax=Stieleria sp. TaxID=2795976 RepID=UPI003567E7F3
QPDLVVSEINAPAVATGGDSVTISWTVDNRGLADADTGAWLDRVYLSDHPDPKAEGARTLLLGEKRRGLPLARGASYTASIDVDLAPAASGQYIVVITDDDLPPQPSIDLSGFFPDASTPTESYVPVQEVDETNNVTAVATTIHAAAANLKVVEFDLPTDAKSGEEVTFRYTVENIGEHPVWSGTTYWKDFLWLTPDTTFIRERASYLGASIHAPAETIDPGDRYTVSFTTTLPEGTGGDYSLWVHLNANNDRSPLLFPYQSRLLLTDWFSAIEGDNDVWRSHFGHWAYEDPGDNLARADLPIRYEEADLTITDLQVPASTTSGATVELVYTVQNTGSRKTRVDSWSDRVFLSRDASLDNFDTELASTSHLGSLEPGESYTGRLSFQIPAGIEGEFNLLLFTDSAAKQDRSGRPSDIGFRRVGIEFELPGVLAPWDLASAAARESARGEVSEYQREGNNIAVRALLIRLSDLPDLQVSTISGPVRADRGQEIDVSYTVTNHGGDTVGGQSDWTDLLYLSRDTFLDLASDIYLGSSEHNGGLAAGASYQNNTSVSLPAGLTGPYYLFVISDPDRFDATGDVFEGPNERNNAASPATPMVIELPDPVDLQVTEIVVPHDVTAGTPTQIQWTVTNTSDVTVSGRWSDSLFFSSDATWDIHDAAAGRAEFRGTLAPGESYTSTLEVVTPPLTPSSYRAIVRADIFDQVYEDVGESNNQTASASTMQLTVPSLTLDVPLETT